MHRTRACCRSSTVSAQKRYSLIASPGQSSTSVEGMSSRARRRALGSAWMSEMMPIFIFLSFLLCSGFRVAKQEALSLMAYGLGIWLMAYSLGFMAYGRNHLPILQDATARLDWAVESQWSERA